MTTTAVSPLNPLKSSVFPLQSFVVLFTNACQCSRLLARLPRSRRSRRYLVLEGSGRHCRRILAVSLPSSPSRPRRQQPSTTVFALVVVFVVLFFVVYFSSQSCSQSSPSLKLSSGYAVVLFRRRPLSSSS
ncbi:hypothetical protein EX30DRAFT_107314 [Ascodesmis nigricans]|uniref:Transmembrane protein n=1 Tax=Ascodesmis nigricans TaxID=341454 RepID=A0A4V3SIB8_9PEZI|nr:hypothetical protein EX30DRAFT_107314 [Ascodesmis nigricans]